MPDGKMSAPSRGGSNEDITVGVAVCGSKAERGFHVRIARGLFGTHVMGSAEAESGLCDASSARLSHGQRDAEVGYEGLGRERWRPSA